MVSTTGAMDTVVDLIDDILTLVFQVLIEDVFFEIVWNKLLVFIFINLASTWGFLLLIVIFLYYFNKKYVEIGG